MNCRRWLLLLLLLAEVISIIRFSTHAFRHLNGSFQFKSYFYFFFNIEYLVDGVISYTQQSHSL